MSPTIPAIIKPTPKSRNNYLILYLAAVRARLGTLTRNYKILSGSELIELGIRDCNEPKTNEPRILVASAAAGKPPLAAQPGAEEPILAGLMDKMLSVFGVGKAAGAMHNRVAVSSRPAAKLAEMTAAAAGAAG